MRRLVGALLCAGACLVSNVARAYDNDLQLYKLGSPADLKVANADGTAQDRPADPFAQERFARFVSEFALAMLPMPSDLNASVGDAGFSIAFSPQVAFVHARQQFTSDSRDFDVWPIEAELKSNEKTLFLPTLHLRKGLPFSLEVATDITYLASSAMVGVSGSVKWAVVEGFQWFPDVAVRAFGGTVLGTNQLSLVTGGWDAGMSYRFPIAWSAEAGLYGGYQRVGLNATTGNIDFEPRSELAGDPSSDDKVFQPLPIGSVLSPSTGFHRLYFGAQVRTGVLVLGLDASSAWGTNPTYEKSPATFDTSMVKVAGRVGVTF